jgi:Rrf2 family protein
VLLKFLEGILRELRHEGLVAIRRGADGGYRLDRSPAEVSIADEARALDGPLAAVRGRRPEDLQHHGASEHLRDVWIALRVARRRVMENISLTDIASGQLPVDISSLLSEPGACERR